MNDESPETQTPTTPAPIPPAEIDPERQHKAARYAFIQRWLSLADTALGLVIILAILLTGIHLSLRDILSTTSLATWTPIHNWPPLLIAVYGLIFVAVTSIISLPLAYYSGFILPRRYEISTQTLWGWIGDLIKSSLLVGIFLVVLIEIIFLLLATQPNTWWLWIAGGILIFGIVLSNLAPVLLVPLFYKLIPLPDGELRQRLLSMAARAKTRVQGVYILKMSAKTRAGNAAVMGLGNTRRIVIGDTILSEYSPEEIEVILAHEIGHQVHNDIWKGVFFSSVLTFAMLAFMNIALHTAVVMPVFGLHNLADVAAMPLLGVLAGTYSFLLGPLQNTMSRIIEYQADHFALDLTRDPVNFKSAFRRLANQNLAQLEPNRIIEILFYDHPAIGKRIHEAEIWESQQHS